jgi:hypothetical protein
VRKNYVARREGATGTGHWPSDQEKSLLLIILNDLRRAHFRFVRVKAGVAKRTSLAQEIPALIQFDPELGKPLTIGLRTGPVLVQSVFLCD